MVDKPRKLPLQAELLGHSAPPRLAGSTVDRERWVW
jgi:hypothetical protein